MGIDFVTLRHDLLEYAGTAWANGNPMAMAEMLEIESASSDELLMIAARMGFIVWDDDE